MLKILFVAIFSGFSNLIDKKSIYHQTGKHNTRSEISIEKRA